MTYKHTSYQAVRFSTPMSDQASQFALLDYANSELVTIASGVAVATALPTGCYAARVTNLGANAVHIRGDGVAATTDAPGIPAGQTEPFVVTAADRIFRFAGTNGDTVTITPFLVAQTSVADQV